MELKITAIGNKGDINNERVGIQVINSCKLEYYILFRTNFIKNGFYNKSQSTYWFAPLEIKKGDSIVIYTRRGTDSTKSNEDGTTTYFFYWGLDKPIFTDDTKGIVLVQVNSWQLTKGI